MSDDPSVLAGTQSARLALEQSEKALWKIIEAFDGLEKRMEAAAGEVSPSELTRTKTALGQARSQLVDEVSKHEKRVLQSNGLVEESAIDFDELRASIGGKLDRIRATRGAE